MITELWSTLKSRRCCKGDRRGPMMFYKHGSSWLKHCFWKWIWNGILTFVGNKSWWAGHGCPFRCENYQAPPFEPSEPEEVYLGNIDDSDWWQRKKENKRCLSYLPLGVDNLNTCHPWGGRGVSVNSANATSYWAWNCWENMSKKSGEKGSRPAGHENLSPPGVRICCRCSSHPSESWHTLESPIKFAKEVLLGVLVFGISKRFLIPE